MKIAMLGHKQFPTRSGGVEVVVLELASRLAADGYDVTVYDRGKNGGPKEVMGVKRIETFTFKKEALNAFLASFFATFKILPKKYDIVHYNAIGPSVPIFLAHLFGKNTVSTVHGLNWRVDKWNRFAKWYLKLGEKMAVKYADEVVVLSEEMHRYFTDTYGRDTTLIPNGVSIVKDTPAGEVLSTLGVESGKYILYVGRVSPEKGPQDLIKAFNKSDVNAKLVIVGKVPDNEFGEEIKTLASDNKNIVFAGFRQGKELDELYSNCGLYVLPSHTEGLALTLLEAMSCGAKCLVSDIPENTCVLRDFGFSFKTSDTDSLAEMLTVAFNGEIDSEKEKEHIEKEYSYDSVVNKHKEMYQRILDKKAKVKSKVK